ncbi:F0F1 ATP synthase subunit B [Thioalbus denitrificans]|uniref:ATP synthase subunit b n=1 Tax=Thioalbus denitrificans TaxID=547122 RepID=A0A369CFA8_9GAMM|nr:F0F1 ATP synthase subunit B [Thioalbus denitrificans]RCX32740.1 ATP synthase F0 subcomplex B subunit [Thioalbus denitrificans]
MLVDWFTVGAQALNFIILVWLLKRFLYKPILHAIDAREKRIAAELADADGKRAEATRERDEYRRKNELFDQERATLLSQATDAASAERLRLLDEARQAADTLRSERQDAVLREQQSLSDEITRRTREEVFAIARRTLTDLAGVGLEERMTEVFTQRLRDLGGEAKEELARALAGASAPARVRSSFGLPEVQRAAIRKALNETFSADIPLQFETAPDIISGIELTTNGLKVAWSIADYLASLEKSVGDVLKEQARTTAGEGGQRKPGADAEAGGVTG